MLSNRTEYIQIHSIDDLDPARISLTQIGRKYIDREGNRFTTRFNKETRKVELVRIFVKSAKEMIETDYSGETRQTVQHEIPATAKIRTVDEILDDSNVAKLKSTRDIAPISEKITFEAQTARVPEKAASENTNNDLADFDLDIDDTPAVSTSQVIEAPIGEMEERDFLAYTLKEFEKTKERISAMLNNLKSSKIFESTGDPSENQNIMGNLSREFDVEVFQSMDKIINYYKELTSYPRPIGYYSSKYDKTRKDKLGVLPTEKDMMHVLIKWEMQDQLFPVYLKMKKLMLELLVTLNTKTESHIRQLPFGQQQFFTDAKNAAVFCSQDIESTLKKLELWKSSE